MKKNKKKKIKVIITENINRTLKSKSIVEIYPGYANYLFMTDKAILYTPYDEYLINQSVQVDEYTKEYELISQYINNQYLYLERSSNKSLTLYGKITRKDIIDAINIKLTEKNVPANLIAILNTSKTDSIISDVDIKSSNLVYNVKLIGNFEGCSVNLCVASTKEQCESLESAHKKEVK